MEASSLQEDGGVRRKGWNEAESVVLAGIFRVI
jgi:hypothetical protein